MKHHLQELTMLSRILSIGMVNIFGRIKWRIRKRLREDVFNMRKNLLRNQLFSIVLLLQRPKESHNLREDLLFLVVLKVRILVSWAKWKTVSKQKHQVFLDSNRLQQVILIRVSECLRTSALERGSPWDKLARALVTDLELSSQIIERRIWVKRLIETSI